MYYKGVIFVLGISYQQLSEMKKGHKSSLLSRITSVGTHSVPFLNNWNGWWRKKKKFATIIKWNFTSGNQMWAMLPNSREARSFIFWLFSTFEVRKNEENEQVLLSSSLVLVYTLVKACLFPSIFFKKKSEIAWRIGHWKDSVVLLLALVLFFSVITIKLTVQRR